MAFLWDFSFCDHKIDRLKKPYYKSNINFKECPERRVFDMKKDYFDMKNSSEIDKKATF